MENMSTVLSLVSLIVSITAIINFIISRRKADMDEGARREQAKRMEKDLGEMFEKMRCYEKAMNTQDKEIIGLKKDVEYIKKTADEIKEMVQRITPQ